MTQPADHPATTSCAGLPAPGEISALIAWMRRLSDAGVRQADPAELAAFQHAKHDLLTRIEHPATPYDQPGDIR